MKLTVAQIAEIIGAEIEGDASIEIHDFAKIEEGKQGTITFLANPKYTDYIYTTLASAAIVDRIFEPRQPLSITLLRVDNPYKALSQLMQMVEEALTTTKQGREEPVFVHNQANVGQDVYLGAFAYIGAGATIGSGAQIYPHCYIGEGVQIGAGTVVYPNVSIYRNCIIGENCIIHSGVVIGSDGFGFASEDLGAYNKIPQLGAVKIGNNVEIGSNTCIDRATFGYTQIEDGVKLDNLIQVAHNVIIGKNTVIAAQAGISGSTKLGEQCLVGGKSGFAGHLNIAPFTIVTGMSGVSKSVNTPGTTLRGVPAQPIRDQLKTEAMIRRLGKMEKRIEDLERKPSTTP